MDFFNVILFLIMYYIRPQEWSAALSTIHFVQIVMLTALGTLLFRNRSFSPRDLFKTPHDWAVFAFWLWIVVSAVSPWDTFRESVSLYIFYFVIVQTLFTLQRLELFLGWWTGLIVFVALLALAGKWGFDPLSSAEVTALMKDRLVLNLSIFNNPNALGHSVVPAIPMIYYYFIWKRPVIMRVIGTALMPVPIYCIYLTVSKGAFVSGAVTIIVTLLFGRPRYVQALVVAGALLFGTAALYSLPRMQELKKSKSDEAIQGRVMAFQHGYKMMMTTTHGVGFREWTRSFLAGQYRFKRTQFDKESLKKPMPIVLKAPHSSYVMIGAELGRQGFFLFFAVCYCSLRTVITARSENAQEERIRRLLFILVVSYMTSSWMVDFGYRPTFFMFIAAIAALHRHLHGITRQSESAPVGESPPMWARSVWHPTAPSRLALAGPPGEAMADHSTVLLAEEQQPAPAETAPLPAPASRIGWAWNRIGLLDLVFTLLLTIAATQFWSYLLRRM